LAPWASSIATKFRALLNTDYLGTTAISLLSSSLAPSTYAKYDIALSHYFSLCAAEGLPPLQATAANMAVRYTAWLGLLDTVDANSMQPYFSCSQHVLKLKLFTTCAGKLDRLLSLGPLYKAIHDL
jgi:hypothetical protein